MRTQRSQRHAIAACALELVDLARENFRLWLPVISEVVLDQGLNVTVTDGEIKRRPAFRHSSCKPLIVNDGRGDADPSDQSDVHVCSCVSQPRLTFAALSGSSSSKQRW